MKNCVSSEKPTLKVYDPNEGTSESWREYAEGRFSNQKLLNFIHDVINTAKRDAKENDSTTLLFKLLEELGEYGTAKAGHKKVDESPHQELVDLVITALSLYSLEGGTIDHLAQYGKLKLQKYKERKDRYSQ